MAAGIKPFAWAGTKNSHVHNERQARHSSNTSPRSPVKPGATLSWLSNVLSCGGFIKKLARVSYSLHAARRGFGAGMVCQHPATKLVKLLFQLPHSTSIPKEEILQLPSTWNQEDLLRVPPASQLLTRYYFLSNGKNIPCRQGIWARLNHITVTICREVLLLLQIKVKCKTLPATFADTWLPFNDS